MKPLRLFIIDAWALVPALIFPLFWSIKTLVIAVVGVVCVPLSFAPGEAYHPPVTALWSYFVSLEKT